MNSYERAIEHYGEKAQLEKTLEELKELRLEVRRALEGRLDKEALVSEVADVLNMLQQLQLIFDFSSCDVLRICGEKMQRTMERIQKEKEGEGE